MRSAELEVDGDPGDRAVLLRSSGDAPVRLDARDLLDRIMDVARDRQPQVVTVRGVIIYGNAEWARLRLPCAVTFTACHFEDDADFGRAVCDGLNFSGCSFGPATAHSPQASLSAVDAIVSGTIRISECRIGHVNLNEAAVGGHLEIRDVHAVTVRLDRMRVDGDVTLDRVQCGYGAALAPGYASPVWAVTLRRTVGRQLQVRDSRFARGLDVYGARFESVKFRQCDVGTSRSNVYEVPSYPTLGNSIKGGEATLLLSRVEASSVEIGEGVRVAGDVRLLNLAADTLRIGADTDWSRRTEGVPSAEAALTIDGGILYAKDMRASRTEIQIRTPSGLAPSMLLNDSDVGDVSIYRMSIGGMNGRACLYGTRYGNLEFRDFAVASEGLAFPRHKADTDLPGLMVIRDYSYALRYAEADEPGSATSHTEDRDRTKFRGQPYLALAAYLAATGDADGAREVRICMQDDMRKLSRMPLPSRAWNWVSGFTVKYGYKVQRTVLPLILMILLAGAIVIWGRAQDNFVAMQPDLITTNAKLMGEPEDGARARQALKASECTNLYPCMESISYTVDMLLPFGGFSQVAYWQPRSDWPVRHVLTGLVAGTWIATTILIAALSGIARRAPEAQ